MNPGFKYTIDQSILRSKLLESTSSSMDQAWEKFETYLSQQKPIFAGAKKTRINLMIQPTILIRGFLAALIILPSILFYQQFNAKIPAVIEKAYSAPVNANKEKTKKIQKPSPVVVQAQASVAPVEIPTLPKSASLSSAVVSRAETAQKKAGNRANLAALSVSTNKAPKNQAAQTPPTPSVVTAPVPDEMVISPQIEEPTEFIENPL